MFRDDRMVHGHQLRAVRKRAFHLHLVDHLGDAVEHVRAPEQPPSQIHQLRDRTAVADELEQLRGDERDGFDVIQAQAARQPLLRQDARLVEHELVDLAGCQMHRFTICASRDRPPSRAGTNDSRLRRVPRTRSTDVPAMRTMQPCSPSGERGSELVRAARHWLPRYGRQRSSRLRGGAMRPPGPAPRGRRTVRAARQDRRPPRAARRDRGPRAGRSTTTSIRLSYASKAHRSPAAQRPATSESTSTSAPSSARSNRCRLPVARARETDDRIGRHDQQRLGSDARAHVRLRPARRPVHLRRRLRRDECRGAGTPRRRRARCGRRRPVRRRSWTCRSRPPARDCAASSRRSGLVANARVTTLRRPARTTRTRPCPA